LAATPGRSLTGVPPEAATLAYTLLPKLRGVFGGLEIDEYDHSLQTATRAERAGADDELIVAALCHDMAKAFTPLRHDRVGADLLRPYVRREVSWVLGIHQDFTAREFRRGLRRHTRLRHRLHPSYRLACRFVDEWDLPARDPTYDTLPLEHFRPVVDHVLGRPRRWRARRRLYRRLVRRLRRVTAAAPTSASPTSASRPVPPVAGSGPRDASPVDPTAVESGGGAAASPRTRRPTKPRL
jgi:predicted HD phosphohydrolase